LTKLFLDDATNFIIDLSEEHSSMMIVIGKPSKEPFSSSQHSVTNMTIDMLIRYLGAPQTRSTSAKMTKSLTWWIH
jgi:hypothetical protein